MSLTNVVVFRRWDDPSGDVIALFPEIPADIEGQYCLSYEHVGQHGGADYRNVIANTVPAPVKEAARLARELELIGYRVMPVRRATWRHHERRRAAARALRATPA
jgi:hypothetical protein